MNKSTRRNFLKGTAAGIAVACLPMQARAAEELNPIDAHVHVWTSDTKAFPLASGVEKASMSPVSFTPEELFAQCKPVGVNRIVLIQMSYYGTDNSYMLHAIKTHRQNFRGVAIIDETQPDAAATMQKLKQEGVSGFRLYADHNSVEKWQNSKTMHAMWQAAAEHQQAICLLANPDALPGIQKLCERFPKTRVVIDHFARIGMTGEVVAADLENLCRLAAFPELFVKTSAFYALGKKKPPYTDLGPMVKRLRDTFGPQRLMWASDCPFQVQGIHTYADSYALIHDRLDFLSTEDKSWMLQKTAEKVFWS